MITFSRRIHEALDLAARSHEGQARKDPDRHTPYVSHVVGVGFLLAEYGFDEDVVIAGLLHDVLEDQPEDIAAVEQFGDRVAGLVRAVSERKLDDSGNERPWRDRKGEYAEHIRHAPPDAKAISCADKIHNMQSILLAMSRGADIWGILKATPDEQLKRFRSLREALGHSWSHPILARFDAVFGELERGVQA